MQKTHHHITNMLSWQTFGKSIFSGITIMLAVLGLAACSMTDTVATNETSYAYEIDILEGDTPALIAEEYQVEVVEWDSEAMVAIVLSQSEFSDGISTQGRRRTIRFISSNGKSGWSP